MARTCQGTWDSKLSYIMVMVSSPCSLFSPFNDASGGESTSEMSASQVLEQFAQVSDRKCHEDVNLDKVLTRYFTGKKCVLV